MLYRSGYLLSLLIFFKIYISLKHKFLCCVRYWYIELVCSQYAQHGKETKWKAFSIFTPYYEGQIDTLWASIYRRFILKSFQQHFLSKVYMKSVWAHCGHYMVNIDNFGYLSAWPHDCIQYLDVEFFSLRY